MAAARRRGGRGLILVATITLVAILCLAGCGGDEAQVTAIILANAAGTTATAVARSANATTTAALIPSGAPTPGGSRPAIGFPTAQASGSGSRGTLVPAGFSLSSSYTLVSNVESDGQIVVLGVASSKDAYDFYKAALPGAGHQVTVQGGTRVPTGGFIRTLAVSNASYDGTAFTPGGLIGQTVTIQLRRT